MKKLIVILLLVGFIHTVSKSQGCLPDGIEFAFQNEIDSFSINYPNCSEVIGSLIISGNDISNLTGLNSLTSVGGNLKFFNTDSISNLHGLHNIVYVGGKLSITALSGINDLTGLDNLSYVAGDVEIGSISLQSLEGLENLDSIGGLISIHCNLIKNLQGLNKNLPSISML